MSPNFLPFFKWIINNQNLVLPIQAEVLHQSYARELSKFDIPIGMSDTKLRDIVETANLSLAEKTKVMYLLGIPLDRDFQKRIRKDSSILDVDENGKILSFKSKDGKMILGKTQVDKMLSPKKEILEETSTSKSLKRPRQDSMDQPSAPKRQRTSFYRTPVPEDGESRFKVAYGHLKMPKLENCYGECWRNPKNYPTARIALRSRNSLDTGRKACFASRAPNSTASKTPAVSTSIKEFSENGRPVLQIKISCE